MNLKSGCTKVIENVDSVQGCNTNAGKSKKSKLKLSMKILRYIFLFYKYSDFESR